MSGSVVQRGECAIFDKWQRAMMAANAGADLVIELPAYYVLQSADIFAYGGVKLLDDLKIVDGISFGCECGNTDVIKKVAEAMTNPQCGYDDILKSEIKKGIGYPKASENALLSCLPDYALEMSKPNNTLAVGYVKAINKLQSRIIPVGVKRNNDYHSDCTSDMYMSATEIRNRILNSKDYTNYSQDYSGENIYSMKNAESFIIGYLRSVSAEYLSGIKGSEDGLYNLVKNSVAKACTIEELFEMCVNKRYTLHRIKRYILSAILGIDYVENISYARVLAIGKNGKELLKSIKQNSSLDIITKVADYKSQNKMFMTDIKATDFSFLCSNDICKRQSGKDYVTSPYILK